METTTYECQQCGTPWYAWDLRVGMMDDGCLTLECPACSVDGADLDLDSPDLDSNYWADIPW